jgi:hypothetical protein
LLVVALLLVGLVAAGVRVPGGTLARAVASRILCAAAFADGCGDEPALIATYGTEVGKLARRHMPVLAFEEGSRAVPIDFRRCRSTRLRRRLGPRLGAPDQRRLPGDGVRPRGRLP